jgi:hypothetical protein
MDETDQTNSTIWKSIFETRRNGGNGGEQLHQGDAGASETLLRLFCVAPLTLHDSLHPATRSARRGPPGLRRKE